MRGAERGDLDAVALLRRAAREAAAAGPTASVELLKHAESLLPARHPQADVVSGEIVDALLRSGHAAEAAGRATAVLDRAHRPDLDIPLRLSLVSAMSLLNRGRELVDQAEQTLTRQPHLPLPAQALVLAQASLGYTFADDLSAGESTARRALDVAERAGDK